MLSLVWFKRDLRLHDHPALALAAAAGAVLPVYIIEPELWALPDGSARQWAFVAESLAGLQSELAALGQPLILRTGDSVDILAQLHRRHGFGQIVSHEETGNAWTFARDKRVAAWARAQGLPWIELPQAGVVRRLNGRDGWAARRESFVAAGPVTAPGALEPVAPASGHVPSARALRLPDDPCPHRQQGGRSAGLAALESFLSTRGQTYRAAMATPVAGERACSRLSPHLAFGTLSGREVAQASAAVRPEKRGLPDWAGSLRSFEARLAWRDHFMQKLEDQPSIEFRALHPALDTLRPRDPDPVRLAAWVRGETGLPFVDACMRYLRATGWLNFRARAMVMSVASQHLWLDWRPVGTELARLFTDYEPGIHWSQCQMQASVTGMNTIRIYNPVKQGQDQDPTGVFTRRWVPELAEVPDAFLHQPWRWSGAGTLLGRRYPEPLVDPVLAARQAASVLHGLRKTPGFREAARPVIARHASRKAPPAVRRFPRPSPQLSLDL
jgi:deoxyribodipyrimidine photo-lyase